MTQISPNFSHEKLESASIEDFIDVLEDRVVHWLLKPAKTLLEAPHGEIPVVSLLLSYFEAHTIYLKGQNSLNQSKRFFREGFVDVFTSRKHSQAFLEQVAKFTAPTNDSLFGGEAKFREMLAKASTGETR